MLQVKGTSMIEDHIMDGDYVVCEQTQVANAGDIVVALIGDDEATLEALLSRRARKNSAAACEFRNGPDYRGRQ